VSEKSRAVRKLVPIAADTMPPEVATDSITTKTPEFPRLATAASVIRLEEGLYALGIGPMPRLPDRSPHVALPAILLSAPPARRNGCVEIIGTSDDDAGWIGRDGGTVVVKSPPGGGDLWVTAYGPPECAMALPLVEPRRLDRPCCKGARLPQLDAVIEPDEIPTEIVLHIERIGDQRFAGQGWVGNRGRKLRIEAFSIRPTERLAASDIEFKGLGPNGRETPWVTDAKLCGTRGQHLPLTGFAVRLAPHVGDRFDVLYEGAFFESGVAGPYRNGALCISAIAGDPLEAINLRVIRRANL
jgi:hypothetical protein